MKKQLALLLMFIGIQGQALTYLDPLLTPMVNSRSTQTVRVVALLKYPQNLTAPRRYDGPAVKRYLMQLYKDAVQTLVSDLQNYPNDIKVREQFWINNSLALDVTPQGLRILSQNQNVEKVYANRPINYAQPVSQSIRVSRADGDWTYGLKDLGIDRINQERPDINGTGVMVGVVDTGIDGRHPALQGKIALFYDASLNKITEPVDKQEHGTHVSGTIAGGDRQNLKIGVAPGAKIIGSAALDGYDKMLKAMQFMLDPDGNPNTQDSPRLISNSWNCEGAPDVELFYRAITAWEAAGILPVFSAGNSGPKAQSITKPHEHPAVFAVGATGSDFKITSFSSRGPAIFQGQQVQKPDFTAPGDKVYSSVPGGGYQEMSGTSMACPHVSGVSALLFQINPKFTPQNVRDILMKTLKYVDSSGNPIAQPAWNPVYGFGRVDAYAAVKLALTQIAGGRFASALLPINQLSLPIHSFNAAESMNTDITHAFATNSNSWTQIK